MEDVYVTEKIVCTNDYPLGSLENMQYTNRGLFCFVTLLGNLEEFVW